MFAAAFTALLRPYERPIAGGSKRWLSAEIEKATLRYLRTIDFPSSNRQYENYSGSPLVIGTEPMDVEHECHSDFRHRQVSAGNSVRSREQPRSEHEPPLRGVRRPCRKRLRSGYADEIDLLRHAVLHSVGTRGGPRRQRSWKESVMKCSNPDCNRGIGLVAYRRSPFSKRRYCSKRCRDARVADAPKAPQKRSASTYCEWLFLQPLEYPHDKLPAVVRTRAH